MDKLQRLQKLTRSSHSLYTLRTSPALVRNLCTAAAPQKSTQSNESLEEEQNNRGQSFAHLLRHSKFIALGDPHKKVVIGKIFQVVDDDIYIDFGWKFHCVCPRPAKNAELFKRGAEVKIMIKSLELSTRFLGATKDITLCEADCIILGIHSDKKKKVPKQTSKGGHLGRSEESSKEDHPEKSQVSSEVNHPESIKKLLEVDHPDSPEKSSEVDHSEMLNKSSKVDHSDEPKTDQPETTTVQ